MVGPAVPLLLTVCSVLLAHLGVATGTTNAILIEHRGVYDVISDTDHPKALATASYRDWTESSSGWGQLSISTMPGIDDAQQLYAAGLLTCWSFSVG